MKVGSTDSNGNLFRFLLCSSFSSDGNVGDRTNMLSEFHHLCTPLNIFILLNKPVLFNYSNDNRF